MLIGIIFKNPPLGSTESERTEELNLIHEDLRMGLPKAIQHRSFVSASDQVGQYPCPPLGLLVGQVAVGGQGAARLKDGRPLENKICLFFIYIDLILTSKAVQLIIHKAV